METNNNKVGKNIMNAVWECFTHRIKQRTQFFISFLIDFDIKKDVNSIITQKNIGDNIYFNNYNSVKNQILNGNR